MAGSLIVLVNQLECWSEEAADTCSTGESQAAAPRDKDAGTQAAHHIAPD